MGVCVCGGGGGGGREKASQKIKTHGLISTKLS